MNVRIGDTVIEWPDDRSFDEMSGKFLEAGKSALESGHYHDMMWRDRPIYMLEAHILCHLVAKDVEHKADRIMNAFLELEV